MFFDKWFVAINSEKNLLPRVHGKKLSILALRSLLDPALEVVPEPLRNGWPRIVGGALRILIFKNLPRVIAGGS